MEKVAVFKIEYRKIETKTGKIRVKKVFHFITERILHNTEETLQLYKEYAFFNNCHILHWDKTENAYVFLGGSHKKKGLRLYPIQGIEQY